MKKLYVVSVDVVFAAEENDVSESAMHALKQQCCDYSDCLTKDIRIDEITSFGDIPPTWDNDHSYIFGVPEGEDITAEEFLNLKQSYERFTGL